MNAKQSDDADILDTPTPLEQTDSLNLFRPPFQIIPGQSAENAAVEIVNVFMSIENLTDKVSKVFRAITNCLDLNHLDPLVVAGFSLAKMIDGTAHTNDNAYHNNQHICEVMLSSYFLSLLFSGGLNKQETAEIILAALIHDFQHDGKLNGDTPFRLERNAINEAAPYLLAARMPQTQQQKITGFILATDSTISLNLIRACYLHHIYGDPLPELPSAVPEFRTISEDPLKLIQASILCEADILPSIGLTIKHAFRLQEKLSMEWGVCLGLKDKLQFIDNKFLTFTVGNFFNPNIDKLKLEIQRRLHKMNNET